MYPEWSTVHFENISNITVNSDNVIPQEKQNGGEKYCQVIPYEKNEANKSIEKNSNKTIDFKYYLDNIILMNATG